MYIYIYIVESFLYKDIEETLKNILNFIENHSQIIMIIIVMTVTVKIQIYSDSNYNKKVEMVY